MLPLLAIFSESVGAPAKTLNGVLEPVMSRRKRALVEVPRSLACSAQSRSATPPEEVSSNRSPGSSVLSFTVSLVSNSSPSAQVRPAHRLPWTS
jgi:hypothetical protein